MTATMSSFRYRLEPTRDQAQALLRTARATRWLWNKALEYRNDAWLAARSAGATGIAANLGYVHLSGVLTAWRAERAWLGRVPVVALRGVLKNLDFAFQRFFAGEAGYPKFKSRHDGLRLSYRDRVAVHEGMVRLPGLGWVKFREHRAFVGKAKTASVVFEDGHWFVSIAAEGAFTLPNAGAAGVGLDLGVAQSVTTSGGDVIQFPVATAKERARLRFIQRQISRRTKGSARRRRAIDRLAKTRARIARRRADAAHKLSHRLATTHATIAIEDLRLRNMTRSAKGTVAAPGRNVAAKAGLNRSILEQGHADFVRMLTYKCERSGARIVKVPAHFTSQTCSQCGHCAPENRENQARFQCVACGHQSNADLNAAKNILAAGCAVIAQGGSGISPADELRTGTRRSRSRRAA